VNDDPLINAALSGDTDAFGNLVRKYQDRLYHAMTHMLGSAADAEDVVQDSFVQAFLKLETFRRNSGFYTWLYRIAVNAAISLKRRRRVLPSIDRMHETTPLEPVDRGPSPDGPLIERERAGQLHAAMATLADDYRQVLVLREMEGFDYQAIADVLDLPVGTVRSRLFRARMQLREQLKSVLDQELGDTNHDTGGPSNGTVSCRTKSTSTEHRDLQDTHD
jgi:RNA polymerase sigma-70 factor (ECF subfamily)